MNARSFALAVIVAAALPLAACQSGTTGGGPVVRIGFIGPLTGDASAYGNDALHATEMAIAEWNEKTGTGVWFDLVVEDGQCKGTEATAAIHKLIEIDHVAAVLGGNCSTETLAAAPVAEAAKVVLLAPLNTSKAITAAGDYVFRMLPSSALFGAKAYPDYLKTSGVKTIAMISEDTDYARSIHDAVMANLPAGVTAVFDEKVAPGTKDVRSLLTRLKGMDFGVLIVNMQGPPGTAAVVTQAKELGITQQLLGNDVSEAKALIAAVAKEQLEGMQVISMAQLNETAGAQKDFAEQFRGVYGEPGLTMAYAAAAYDGANILFSVIAKSGTGSDAIRDGLYAVKDYPGVSGTLFFDKNGDSHGIPYALKHWKDGAVVQDRIIPLD